jgi:DNA anti-recombination protein RmuC
LDALVESQRSALDAATIRVEDLQRQLVQVPDVVREKEVLMEENLRLRQELESVMAGHEDSQRNLNGQIDRLFEENQELVDRNEKLVETSIQYKGAFLFQTVLSILTASLFYSSHRS